MVKQIKINKHNRFVKQLRVLDLIAGIGNKSNKVDSLIASVSSSKAYLVNDTQLFLSLSCLAHHQLL